MSTNEAFTATIHAKDHKEWVYWDGHGNRDGFFRDIEELETYCADHEFPLPQTVIACAPRKLHMNANWIIESELEEHHEDAGGSISQAEREELQTFLDGWCERTNVESWDQTTTVVLLWEERDGQIVDLTR